MNNQGVFYHTRSADQLAAPQAMGKPLRRYPLISVANSPDLLNAAQKAYAFSQDYTIGIDNFTPDLGQPPLNTPSPDDANAILCLHSAMADLGSGIGKFTADYAIVPATYDLITKGAYIYPGFPGLLGQDSRNPGQPNGTFQIRLRHEFFILDPAGILNGGNPIAAGHAPVAGTVTDSAGNPVLLVARLADIPDVKASQFYSVVSGAPDFNIPTLSLTPAGGISVGNTSYFETLPTRADYETMIAAAAASGWASTVWSGTAAPIPPVVGVTGDGQLVADNSSEPEIYLGNIVMRITPYILAR